jgi:hypothetical protein
MLNFIIAIIVEAYMKVMVKIRECDVEQEFFVDTTSLFAMAWKKM